MVWAKLKGHPFWPSVVSCESWRVIFS
ncbi:hypothetical protein COB52_04770 [Candidatus Kaiserbacteria bacterium]|nr:MAG: hypothetical protein COB52_04770 [Candidatus Kaiserbacteria bacterium]